MKSNVIQIADYAPKKITRSARENMWIIRLADLADAHPDIALDLLGVVANMFYGTTPQDLIVKKMRLMRESHPDQYVEAMDLINKKYAELFPGVTAKTSPEVYKQLEGL